MNSTESLLKGKSQYIWPPCTNSFRLVAFDYAILLTFCKTSNLNEEVNCTDPFPLVSVPWSDTCSTVHISNQSLAYPTVVLTCVLTKSNFYFQELCIYYFEELCIYNFQELCIYYFQKPYFTFRTKFNFQEIYFIFRNHILLSGTIVDSCPNCLQWWKPFSQRWSNQGGHHSSGHAGEAEAARTMAPGPNVIKLFTDVIYES